MSFSTKICLYLAFFIFKKTKNIYLSLANKQIL